MINYQTILSSFDNKLTLMQWLNKVEDALRNGSLDSVSLTQPTTDTAVFVFNFADGSSLSSPTLSLPEGPQGPQGPQGEAGEDGEDGTSVRILANAVSCTQLGDGYLDANGHLQVLTSLSPRTFTDVGEIRGPQGDTGVSVQNVAINASNHLITTLSDNTTIDAGEIETLQGPQGIQGPQGEAGTNGSDGVSVTNVQVTNTNHLIVTLSNSQTIDAGAISVSGGGGTQLYLHHISYDATFNVILDIITNDATPLNPSSPDFSMDLLQLIDNSINAIIRFNDSDPDSPETHNIPIGWTMLSGNIYYYDPNVDSIVTVSLPNTIYNDTVTAL